MQACSRQLSQIFCVILSEKKRLDIIPYWVVCLAAGTWNAIFFFLRKLFKILTQPAYIGNGENQRFILEQITGREHATLPGTVPTSFWHFADVSLLPRR